MVHLIKYIAVFGISLLTVFIFTPLFIKIAPKLGLIDHPDKRCIHTLPIPLAGGIIVFMGFHVACFALYHYLWPLFSGQLNLEWWHAFILASSFLIGIGLIDDRFTISPLIKLAGQSVAALLLYFLSGYQVNLLNIDFNFFWGMIFVLIWNLTIINAFNLIDGLDGLCSGLALISCAGLAAVFIFRGFPGDALICIALIGSCLGFLRYNFFPAKIFLGDTGSMFLGFSLANISLQAGGKGSLFILLAALFFVAGIPVIDTLLAIWRRSIRKILAKNNGTTPVKVMGADREHLHHRLLDFGLAHKHVAYILYAVNIVIVVLGITYFIYSELAAGMFLIMLIVSLYLLVRYILKIELWETSRLLFNKPENKVSHDFLLVLYLLFDLVWMAMMVWLSGFVALKGEQPFISFGSWANELPFWLFPIFILMFLSKDYIRVWHGSSFKDFFLLNLTIIVGGLLSLAFFLILHADEDYFIIINKTLLFILFSTLGIVGIRIPLHLFRAWSIYNPKSDAAQRRNILIYGAGQHGGLYLRAHYLDYPSEIRESYIVGFIDDNPVLQNKYIFGLPVLAGLSNLEEVALKFHINEIILSTSISDDNFNVLRQLCLKLNIALLKWQAYTTPI
ncbi:MAG: hypothetical protein NTY50_16790 [Methylobacter sp.]|nr:hypothetical protein [Methylobacter sp.]